MKHLLQNIILAILLCIPNIAAAYHFKDNGVYYNFLSQKDKTVEVTYGGSDSYYNYSYSGDVVIPEYARYNGEAYKVVAIGRYAFGAYETSSHFTSSITSVSLPNSITSIGEMAFYKCNKIRTLTIPEGVSEIQYKTFSGCSSLVYLEISGTITKIGSHAFSNCSSLTSLPDLSHISEIDYYAFEGCAFESIILPNSITKICPDAFAGCRQLKKVRIPNTIKVLTGFTDCTNLEDVSIPNSVKRIEGFSNCPNLKRISFPASLDTISEDAFRNSGLTSVKIPANVKYIGTRAFADCDFLPEINVDPRNKKYASPDGILFSKDLDTLVLYPTGSRLRYTYTIPSSVKFVNDYAFASNKGLTEITIPKSVELFGAGAFFDMQNLCSVICRSATPIECADLRDGMFRLPRIPYLYVPKGCVEAYRQADRWKYYFDNISDEIPDYIGVENFEDDATDGISLTSSKGTIRINYVPDNSVIQVFSLHGTLITESHEPEINGLQSGIYIVSVGSKKFKVLVR